MKKIVFVILTLCQLEGYGGDAAALKKSFLQTKPQLLPLVKTDSKVKFHPNASHVYAGCGAGPTCGQLLFVMLAGTHGEPWGYQRVVRAMAASGMAAIGLAYQTDGTSAQSVAAAAQCKNDDACYSNFRRDRTLGAEVSPYVLSQQDGILPRLLAALKALKWTNFYENDQLKFERIVFAGHSQGAGMAAWIGKRFAVRRVVQFSGTSDAVRAGAHRGRRVASASWVPASWTTQPGKTPSEEYFAFFHPADPFYSRDKIVWSAMGMQTDISPWNNPHTHVVETDLPFQPNCRFKGRQRGMCGHTQVVADPATPEAVDGTPLFLETWVRLGNPTYPK